MGQALRILVVEDEMTIALLLEDMVEELGHEVAGVAMRLAPALEQARALEFDLALLDVNLDGMTSFPIADVLRARGIRYLFATGYGRAGIAPDHAEAIVLKKPFLQADLADAIGQAMRG